jgi:hypothetical protein
MASVVVQSDESKGGDTIPTSSPTIASVCRGVEAACRATLPTGKIGCQAVELEEQVKRSRVARFSKANRQPSRKDQTVDFQTSNLPCRPPWGVCKVNSTLKGGGWR